MLSTTDPWLPRDNYLDFPDPSLAPPLLSPLSLSLSVSHSKSTQLPLPHTHAKEIQLYTSKSFLGPRISYLLNSPTGTSHSTCPNLLVTDLTLFSLNLQTCSFFIQCVLSQQKACTTSYPTHMRKIWRSCLYVPL